MPTRKPTTKKPAAKKRATLSGKNLQRVVDVHNGLAEQEIAGLKAELNLAGRVLEDRGKAIEQAMGRYRGTEPLVEAVARLSRDYHTEKLSAEAWERTAGEFSRSERFLRDTIQQLGPILGPEVYTSDDGTVNDDVLVLKVVEAVRKLAEPRSTWWRFWD